MLIIYEIKNNIQVKCDLKKKTVFRTAAALGLLKNNQSHKIGVRIRKKGQEPIVQCASLLRLLNG